MKKTLVFLSIFLSVYCFAQNDTVKMRIPVADTGKATVTQTFITGYEVYQYFQNGDTALPGKLIATLDLKKKPIGKPYIKTGAGIPISGFSFFDIWNANTPVVVSLNPKDIEPGLTLSNGNLTVTGNPPPTWDWACVRGTNPFPIGKKSIFEVYINSMSDNFAIGVCRLSDSLNKAPGHSSTSFAYESFNGFKNTGGLPYGLPYGNPYKTGDYVTVLVDLTQTPGTIATKLNGVNQGIMFTGLTGNLYPVFGTSQKTMATVNFGSKPIIYPKTGYTPLQQ